MELIFLKTSGDFWIGTRWEIDVKPLFTVHAGEFLVVDYVDRHFRSLNVWIPAKDTGVDLLVSDRTNKHTVSMQEKGHLTACGRPGRGSITLSATPSGSGPCRPSFLRLRAPGRRCACGRGSPRPSR